MTKNGLVTDIIHGGRAALKDASSDSGLKDLLHCSKRWTQSQTRALDHQLTETLFECGTSRVHLRFFFLTPKSHIIFK